MSWLLLCGPDEPLEDVDGETWIEEAETEKRVKAINDVHDGRNLGTTVFAVFRKEADGTIVLQDKYCDASEEALREALDRSEVNNENPLLEVYEDE